MWFTRGSAAAGNFYFTIALENMTRHTCSLFGYPGISAVDLAGHRIGAAAGREPSGPAAVMTLRPERSVATIIHVTDVALLPSPCHQTLAAGFRVYPPGNRVSRVVWFPFRTCENAAYGDMRVRAIQAEPTE